MKIYVWALASIVLFTSCDKDDDDNNNGNMVSNMDREFVLKASMGNTAEIDAGQLASTKADNTGIRDFGSMMVSDHGGARSELKQIAQSLSVYAPDSIDAEHVALKQVLVDLDGHLFDSAYIRSQVTDHEKTIALFENEADNGSNNELRAYANKQLPHLRMHLQKADSLATAIGIE